MNGRDEARKDSGNTFGGIKDIMKLYISKEVEDDFDLMFEELYILLVKENDDEIYSHECQLNTILVTGDRNIDGLGRYIAGAECSLNY